jgi:hypothetical protein
MYSLVGLKSNNTNKKIKKDPTNRWEYDPQLDNDRQLPLIGNHTRPT